MWCFFHSNVWHYLSQIHVMFVYSKLKKTRFENCTLFDCQTKHGEKELYILLEFFGAHVFLPDRTKIYQCLLLVCCTYCCTWFELSLPCGKKNKNECSILHIHTVHCKQFPCPMWMTRPWSWTKQYPLTCIIRYWINQELGWNSKTASLAWVSWNFQKTNQCILESRVQLQDVSSVVNFF